MKNFYILVFFLCASGSALAQPMGECREIMPSGAGDDVAYRAGVDVSGRPVVPADLTAPMLGSDESVVVPVSVEFANQLGYADPNVGMEGVIGFVEVWPDGRVSYNGRDLTGRVEAICEDKPVPPASGQKQRRTIESEPVPAPANR